MYLFAFLLIAWIAVKLARCTDLGERILDEQHPTNGHLRKIRDQAAWEGIRARFIVEHGMTIDDYGRRYGLPLGWLKQWSREVNAASL
jgi:hypothetical protein